MKIIRITPRKDGKLLVKCLFGTGRVIGRVCTPDEARKLTEQQTSTPDLTRTAFDK